MNQVVADTFFWIALTNIEDSAHEQAKDFVATARPAVIFTTEQSLTDCISMEVMRREGISDVLTNDRHFEQEGFRALFREN